MKVKLCSKNRNGENWRCFRISAGNPSNMGISGLRERTQHALFGLMDPPYTSVVLIFGSSKEGLFAVSANGRGRPISRLLDAGWIELTTNKLSLNSLPYPHRALTSSQDIRCRGYRRLQNWCHRWVALSQDKDPLFYWASSNLLSYKDT